MLGVGEELANHPARASAGALIRLENDVHLSADGDVRAVARVGVAGTDVREPVLAGGPRHHRRPGGRADDASGGAREKVFAAGDGGRARDAAETSREGRPDERRPERGRGERHVVVRVTRDAGEFLAQSRAQVDGHERNMPNMVRYSL